MNKINDPVISRDASSASLGHCPEVLDDATVEGPSSSCTGSRQRQEQHPNLPDL